MSHLSFRIKYILSSTLLIYKHSFESTCILILLVILAHFRHTYRKEKTLKLTTKLVDLNFSTQKQSTQTKRTLICFTFN